MNYSIPREAEIIWPAYISILEELANLGKEKETTNGQNNY